MAQGLKREYRSPVAKLLSFFERSRDNWKEKHHAIKRKCSKALERLKMARQRRDCWKARALAAEALFSGKSNSEEPAKKKLHAAPKD